MVIVAHNSSSGRCCCCCGVVRHVVVLRGRCQGYEASHKHMCVDGVSRTQRVYYDTTVVSCYRTCSAVEKSITFFIAPILGKISDSYGRRVVLQWSFAIHALALLGMALDPGEYQEIKRGKQTQP